MEENKNIEVVEAEETNLIPVEENCDDSYEEEDGSLVPVVIGSILAVGALTAFTFRKKISAKLEQRSIEKLRKKGYDVLPQDEEDLDGPCGDVDEEEIEEK